ncbi:MAG: hypothetical protein ACOVSR_13920 [Bacteroidia bacterium]
MTKEIEINLENYLNSFNITKEMLDRLDIYYPKILVPTIPLSLTGVTPRNFHSWKENGLIELSIEKEEGERKNVKFNLIEFIWVKMIKDMREFGFPYDLIRQVKFALFSDAFSQLKYSWHEIEELCVSVLKYNEIQINSVRVLFDKTVEIFDEILESKTMLEIEKSFIFIAVATSILNQIRSSILILKTDFGFNISVITLEKLPELSIISADLLSKTSFQIPIHGLIADFFNEPKSEKYGELFGFYNPKEMKVLEAIRKNDYAEIIIKLDKSNELVIDIVKDGNITDEKAAAIRKILGLNEYEEINLKYRNDKNLYFRNKKRLAQ